MIYFTRDYKSSNSDDQLNKFNKELIEKVNKITGLILNFANFISGHFHNSNNVIIISPILNLSLIQLIKLIKINKIIIDGILTNENDHDNELLNKLNNDLSISFNLLNLNLSNLKFGNSIELILKNKITHFINLILMDFLKTLQRVKNFGLMKFMTFYYL